MAVSKVSPQPVQDWLTDYANRLKASAPVQQNTSDIANLRTAQYLGQDIPRPAAPISINDIINNTGAAFNQDENAPLINKLARGAATAVGDIGEYIQTPEGLRTAGTIAEMQGTHGSLDVAPAYFGQAQEKQNLLAQQNQLANEQIGKQAEVAAGVTKTGQEQTGNIVSKGMEQMGEKERTQMNIDAQKNLEEIRGGFGMKEKAMDLQSAKQLAILDKATQLKIAGMTDERERQVATNDLQDKIYTQIQKDADAQKLSGDSREHYMAARLMGEHPSLEWSGYLPRILGGQFNVASGAKAVTRNPVSVR